MLKWSKRRFPLIPPNKEQNFPELLDFPAQNCTPYKEGILGYIEGFIVQTMVKDISCDICAETLLFGKNQTTYKLLGSYESLIFVKDRGDLFTSPVDVCKIITVAGKYFRCLRCESTEIEHFFKQA